MTRVYKSLLLILILTIVSCSESNQADLIIHNAKIYTVNDLFEIAEAMVIDSGKIIAIGPEHEILNKYSADKVIDARKRPIYPGFIDANCNFIDYALSLKQTNLATSLLNAQQKLFELGITTIDATNLSKEHIDLINQLQQDEKLKLKVYAMISGNDEMLEYYLNKGPYKTDKLNVCSFKFYLSNNLFTSHSNITKSKYNESFFFEKYAPRIYEKGFQMNTDCIGDSSNRMILDIYGKTLKGINDKRWRINSSKTINLNDLKKFKQFTIIPFIGQNKYSSNIEKKLLSQNGIICLGSGFPNEEINPFSNFLSIIKNNSISRKEALKGMTIWAAISNFEENEKGSLEVGKSADFIILDNDIIETKAENILKVIVIQTFINGENVFSQKK